MKKREQYKRLLNTLAIILLLAVQTGTFAGVWFLCYGERGAHLFERGNLVIIAIYVLMYFFFNKLYDGFKVGYGRVFAIIYSQGLSVICVNTMTYFQLCLIARWQFMDNALPMIQMTVFQLIVIVIWSVVTKIIYVKLYPPRKMLLVYGAYSPDRLMRKIQTQDENYNIQNSVSIDEDMDMIKAQILKNGNVVLTDIPADIRNELLKFCFEHDVRCYCVPKISDVMIRSAESIHLLDTTLLLFRNAGLTGDQLFVKRVFDVVVSLMGIILASPFMLVIAIAIRLYDGGPVLFVQDRLTKDGKVFKLYKFRSMRVEKSQSRYIMTRKNDERITPVGKIIRNLHLDELPQLFNILKGDMSIVGPRPECPSLSEEYREIIPQFHYRLKVKAGLTGYAQVYGKYNTTPYDKLKLDLFYIENYSFFMDIKLMLLTVKILFQKDSTEGIESWQTSAAEK